MTKELKALKDLREDAKNHLTSHTHYLNKKLDIIETTLKTNKRKLDVIGEILVDVSKGNYANLNTAIDEIRRVLEDE